MTPNINGRLLRVERLLAQRGGREVLITAAERDDHPHGTIETYPGGAILRVHHQYAADPIEGLTEAQRAYLKPGDLVTVDCVIDYGDETGFSEYTFRWDTLTLTWGDVDQADDQEGDDVSWR